MSPQWRTGDRKVSSGRALVAIALAALDTEGIELAGSRRIGVQRSPWCCNNLATGRVGQRPFG